MSWREEIQKHYESVWRNKAILSLFSNGPISELPADFAVLKFPPTRDRSMWTFATCCMSAPYDSSPIELHVFSEIDSDEIVELLYVIAHYHRIETHLDLNHTVNFGRGWQRKSKCEYGFISRPYLDGPDLENLTTQGGKALNFYWLIPVTRAEVEFRKQFGTEALEKVFDKGLGYLDPARASLV
jgi:hypothetical protein